MAPFVVDFRVLGRSEVGKPVESIPDGSTQLLFSLTAGNRAAMSIAGPRTRALFKRVPSAELIFFLRLRPGVATSLLGVPVSELTDRIVELADLWGNDASTLIARLITAGDDDSRLAALEQALLSRSRRVPQSRSARLAGEAVRVLTETGGRERIDTVAAELGVTSRHLRRAFLHNVGLGPKEFSRTVRLRRAIAALPTARSLSALALDAGYYDQAHLNADFRDMVGMCPSAYLEARWVRPPST